MRLVDRAALSDMRARVDIRMHRQSARRQLKVRDRT